MHKKTLYLECFSGISGDMTVGALLDLGADENLLRQGLDSLKVHGYDIKIGRTQKCGIDACDFDVVLHEDDKHTYDNVHHHEHRNLYDIYKIIDEGQISDRAKDIAKKIFNIVAKAESKAHGVDIEKVHFHEVGAIDSIVDIVAVAICIDNLDIDEVVVSKIYEGTGHVKCQHGTIPVPVPAVTNIVIDNALSIKITDNPGEMITPTGAAIAAALKTKEGLPEDYKIIKIGLGAGKKDFGKANILRAFIIEEVSKEASEDHIWVLETNLDDCSGENLGFVVEKLMESGGKDVFYTSIFMKKNRPGYKLTVLCEEENIKSMESIIFKNTTSIGIRRYRTDRTILKREIINIDTEYGQVRVKVCFFEGDKYYYPEYEDVKAICDKTGFSFKTVYDRVKLTLG